MAKDIPSSPDQLLDLIAESERHRKFVWTASRVLKEGGLLGRISDTYSERRLVLVRITEFLEELATRGLLQRREEFQSIGYGNESGFDYVGSISRNQKEPL
jgi:hypothetical protein